MHQLRAAYRGSLLFQKWSWINQKASIAQHEGKHRGDTSVFYEIKETWESLEKHEGDSDAQNNRYSLP